MAYCLYDLWPAALTVAQTSCDECSVTVDRLFLRVSQCNGHMTGLDQQWDVVEVVDGEDMYISGSCPLDVFTEC